jgi:hypothetical protein
VDTAVGYSREDQNPELEVVDPSRYPYEGFGDLWEIHNQRRRTARAGHRIAVSF